MPRKPASRAKPSEPVVQKLWPADSVERWPIDRLIPYARNSMVHSEAQINQIAASIREWGWTIPVLAAEDGTIIAGHARVMAAQKLSITEVPVMIARGWSDAQKRAYVIADNKLARNSTFDNDMLVMELGDITTDGFDLGVIGFSPQELDAMLGLKGMDDEPPEDKGDGYKEQYGVIVICSGAAEQERVFNELQEAGYPNLRVVTT